MAQEKRIDVEEEISRPKRGKAGIVWFIIILVVAVGVVLWLTGNFPALGSTISGGGYQAVFLTNDQVYFGKLSNAGGQFPRLREVYYLQVTQTLQPIGTGGASQNVPNLNLVKLGGELHGPTDEMIINRDHILFYEDLKSDSQVNTAIKQYQEGQNK